MLSRDRPAQAVIGVGAYSDVTKTIPPSDPSPLESVALSRWRPPVYRSQLFVKLWSSLPAHADSEGWGTSAKSQIVPQGFETQLVASLLVATKKEENELFQDLENAIAPL